MAKPALSDVRLPGYKPLIELATGGMATIYVARRVGPAGFERLVVIKRVHPHMLKDREFCDMFRDEARICSTIRHPNVVSLFDVVMAEDELFLVLEYVESVSLRELLRDSAQQQHPIDPAAFVRIFADTLAGLHAAHEAVDLRGNKLNLIHRDVSPQNVIVGVDGTSRLIDFGISKATSRVTSTSSGVLKGKLRYMSPEQVKQRDLDRRADIFAAGVVLFEALTGTRLFKGDDEGDIALAIMLGEVPAPSSIQPGLPASLDEVVAKALATDREDRFQTALEFQEALEKAVTPASARDVARLVEKLGASLLGQRRTELTAAIAESETSPTAPRAFVPASDSNPALVSAAATAPTESEGPSRSTRRTPVLVAGAAVIAAIAVAGTMLAARRAPDSTSPAAGAASAASASATTTATEPPAPTLSATSATAVPSASPTPIEPPASPVTTSRTPRSSPKSTKPDLRRRNPYGSP